MLQILLLSPIVSESYNPLSNKSNATEHIYIQQKMYHILYVILDLSMNGYYNLFDLI